MKSGELERQMVHLTGIVTIPLALIYGKINIGFLTLLLAIFILILSEYYMRKEEIKDRLPFTIKFAERIERIIYDTINSLEREKYIKKYPYFGAFTFYLMIGTSLVLFPIKIAFLAIVVLSVGDSSATLIGSFLGRHNIPFIPSKTWEGTLGGLLTSLVASFALSLFINIPTSHIFVASIVGMGVELISKRINDNITIPLSVGIVLLFVNMI